MEVTVRIYPKSELNPEGYKKLGAAIRDQFLKHLDLSFPIPPIAFGAQWNYEEAGVLDLLGGEPPQPFYLQRLRGIEAQDVEPEIREKHLPNVHELSAEDRERLRRSLGPNATGRFVEMQVRDNDLSRDRRRIVQTLRGFLDSEFIEDVLINDISWDESIDFDLRLKKSECYTVHLFPRSECRREELVILGQAFEEWWGQRNHPKEYAWVLLPGLWHLLDGQFPATIEEQFDEHTDAMAEFEEPSYEEKAFRSVMFMYQERMDAWPNLIRRMCDAVPTQCLESILLKDHRLNDHRLTGDGERIET